MYTEIESVGKNYCIRNNEFQKESSLSAVAVEMEEDVTSSLNTLLDARPDSATPGPRSDSDLERDR